MDIGTKRASLNRWMEAQATDTSFMTCQDERVINCYLAWPAPKILIKLITI